MDSHVFLATCMNNAVQREIHGRTPEELDAWKSQFVRLQEALDEAFVAMLYSVKSGDLIASKARSVTLLDARQSVLDHLEDL